MLNITKNRINQFMDFSKYPMLQFTEAKHTKKGLLTFLIIISIILVLVLFLPWNQNIRANGTINAYKPEQRPQSIQSLISGKIEKWFVVEGQYVEKGDTIVFISEIKEDYLDPNLVQNTSDQMMAKDLSSNSYEMKAQSIDNQISALKSALNFKIQEIHNKIKQTQYKISAARADLSAYKNENNIAQQQYIRTQELFNKGIKSLSDFEQKNMKYQETQAKVVSQQNKLLTLENELINYQVELSGAQSEYADKIAKSQSDKMSAISNKYDANAQVSKLKNQVNSYKIRNQFYYITAPQSGYVNQSLKKGIGEIVKEGTDIVTILPSEIDIIAEIYIEPIDLPLTQIGEKVLLQFDGWPTVIFSGWPDTSLGTFSGEVIAIDRFTNENGKYRVLVAPNDPKKPWPKEIRIGSGVKSFILLNKVPMWYEVWRQLNGFPPDFYNSNNKIEKKK